MNLFKFLSGSIFNLIGGLFIGVSIPIGPGIFVKGNPMVDFLILAPSGLLLLGISYYYKFVKK
jgi:hypothetical protein